MNRFVMVCASAIVVGASSGSVCAQWTITNLGGGRALGVNQGRQVGNNGHARLWNGTAESAIDLHPVFAPDPHITTSSTALSVFGNLQVGTITITDDVRTSTRAAYWNSSNSEWGYFTPQFSWPNSSSANATDGSQTVGTSYMLGDSGSRARIWGGAILHPDSVGGSGALGVHNGQQVGYTEAAGFDAPHAALWSGTAASWVDLHPAGATHSQARAIHSGQQAGWARINGIDHAGIWTGTASSWVDLTPFTASGAAQALATFGGMQVGYVTVGIRPHASLWNSTAQSWEDLHLALPGSWRDSRAEGMWSDGETLWIVGSGRNNETGTTDALMWSRAIPAPGAAGVLVVGAVMAGRRRRSGIC